MMAFVIGVALLLLALIGAVNAFIVWRAAKRRVLWVVRQQIILVALSLVGMLWLCSLVSR